MTWKSFVGGGLLMIFGFATSARAAPIQGTLNIAGDVIVTLTTIDWTPPTLGGTGQFVIGTTSTGDFAGFPFLTQGTAKDLSSAAQPVGVAFFLANFLLLPNPTNNIAFDLTFITPGNFSAASCFAAPADNQQCTPILPPGFGLSPFELTNTQDATGAIQSTVDFRLSGIVRNVPTGELSSFTGTYSAQFPFPFQTVLSQLATTGQVSNTYSGTFIAQVTPIPEPATLALLGSGLVALGARLRARRKAC